MYESQNAKLLRCADDLLHELARQQIKAVAAGNPSAADTFASMARQVLDVQERVKPVMEAVQSVADELGISVIFEVT